MSQKSQKNRDGYARQWEQHVQRSGGRKEPAKVETLNQTAMVEAQCPVSLGRPHPQGQVNLKAVSQADVLPWRQWGATEGSAGEAGGGGQVSQQALEKTLLVPVSGMNYWRVKEGWGGQLRSLGRVEGPGPGPGGGVGGGRWGGWK